jgi:hypothetical protein
LGKNPRSGARAGEWDSLKRLQGIENEQKLGMNNAASF